jgi:hypothetical protein
MPSDIELLEYQPTFLCHCLFDWGRLLLFIICENGGMSRFESILGGEAGSGGE